MNLRIADALQNTQNRFVRSDNVSGFKGVSRRGGGSWRVRISFGGKRLHIGDYDSAEAAAHAYDQEARKLFGAFARINFPEFLEQSAVIAKVAA